MLNAHSHTVKFDFAKLDDGGGSDSRGGNSNVQYSVCPLTLLSNVRLYRIVKSNAMHFEQEIETFFNRPRSVAKMCCATKLRLVARKETIGPEHDDRRRSISDFDLTLGYCKSSGTGKQSLPSAGHRPTG
jgi:hypothetical protein